MNVSDRFFFSSFHFPSVLLSCSQPLVPNVLSFPLISFPFMFLSLSFVYISFAFRFLSLISFEFQLLSLPFHLIAIVGFLLFLFSCSFCFLSESEENTHTHIYIYRYSRYSICEIYWKRVRVFTGARFLAEGSLEVRFPATWADRWKAEMGTVREEKRRRKKIKKEKVSEERRWRRAKR